jgi:hypothetical protein
VNAAPEGRSGRPEAGALWPLSALALLAAVAALSVTHAALPPCPFKMLTGLPCAACGGTRAALALARLDVASALRWNPLAALALPLFVLFGLAAGVLRLLGRAIPEPRPPLVFRVLGLSALAANWAYLIAAGR